MDRPTLALLLAACVLLAGCASNGGTDPDGSKLAGNTESRILDPDADVSGASGAGDGGRSDSAPGLGEIRGKVVDDAQLPVADATVSLLGTENSTTTDIDGAFRFTNLTPGDFVLRVASEFYRVHEGAAEVRADRITEVTVTLVPQSDRGPGYRPHLHDYWGTNTELPLMDRVIDWGASPSCGGTKPNAAQVVVNQVYEPNNGNWWVCFGIEGIDESLPPIVLPGTAKLRIAITWGSDVDVDHFILGINTASMGPTTYADQEPVASGQEREFKLEEGDADNGHQMFSLWQFRIKPAPRPAPPMTITGPIQVTMTMIRGELPVDPAHEDFWNGTTDYLMRSFETGYVMGTVCCTDTHVVLRADAKRLVPPGTSSLLMRLTVKSTNAAGTPHDLDWTLAVKPANLPPEADWADYIDLTPTANSNGVKSFALPVTPGQTDAFYQSSSNWHYWVHLPSNQHTPIGTTEYGHTFWLEVIAAKDPSFT